MKKFVKQTDLLIDNKIYQFIKLNFLIDVYPF